MSIFSLHSSIFGVLFAQQLCSNRHNIKKPQIHVGFTAKNVFLRHNLKWIADKQSGRSHLKCIDLSSNNQFFTTLNCIVIIYHLDLQVDCFSPQGMIVYFDFFILSRLNDGKGGSDRCCDIKRETGITPEDIFQQIRQTRF